MEKDYENIIQDTVQYGSGCDNDGCLHRITVCLNQYLQRVGADEEDAETGNGCDVGPYLSGGKLCCAKESGDFFRFPENGSCEQYGYEDCGEDILGEYLICLLVLLFA